jgi:hypothetical protein
MLKGNNKERNKQNDEKDMGFTDEAMSKPLV